VFKGEKGGGQGENEKKKKVLEKKICEE